MENQNDHKLHTALLIILIIMAGIIIWLLVSCNCCAIRADIAKDTDTSTPVVPVVPTPTPVPPKPIVIKPTSITVNLNQEFTINLNQTVILAGQGATLTLTGFYNHPCAATTQCIWSGLDVFYTIKDTATGTTYVKNQPLQTVPNSPFSVVVKNSDYATSANIVVQKSNSQQ